MTPKKTNNIWTFKDQLKVGDRGEQLFLEKYPRKLTIYPGREYDFTINSSRETVELKTDTYNINKTENFFFERYSDVTKETPGGPWRAKKDKVDIFCYYFVRHNVWFEFRDVPALITELNKLTKGKGLIYIKNRGWVTGGYKISRDSLSDFYDIYEF
jgi:hypothetical protein